VNMRIEAEHGGQLELRVASAGPSSWGGQSDLLLAVKVAARGFSGCGDVWIDCEAWQAFVHALEALERSRSGSATIEGVSPGELVLAFRVIDHAGHVAFSCMLGQRTSDGDAALTLSDVKFDPSELPNVVRGLKKVVGSQLRGVLLGHQRSGSCSCPPHPVSPTRQRRPRFACRVGHLRLRH
jgi:hypothetical protein